MDVKKLINNASAQSIPGDKYHIRPDAMNFDEHTIVLNHSNSFAIIDRWGNIFPSGKQAQGIYYKGTRFVNRIQFTVNGLKPLLLSSTIKENNNIFSADLANPILNNGEIPENSIHFFRHQFLKDNSFFEKITCSNYSEKKCRLVLGLFFDADFKDIFEIRGMPRKLVSPKVEIENLAGFIELNYTGQDKLQRKCIIKFCCEKGFEIKGRDFIYPVYLRPGQEFAFHYSIHFMVGSTQIKKDNFDTAKRLVLSARKKNEDKTASITSNNSYFNSWLSRSYTDLFSLCGISKRINYPYAGVPWYNTQFGRDGIITAIECLLPAPELAKDVLWFLASCQAKTYMPMLDAEPGKIIHEVRSSEMANTGEVPFKSYYGTVDATPLFLILAGMYYQRTNDLVFLEKIWPNIIAALDWINIYGDKDKDGFVEYSNETKTGLVNQGWKDSVDCIMHENGILAEGDIALCEVQAYVYAAKKHVARIAGALHKETIARQLKREAVMLKRNFERVFWDDAMQCYILALDGDKKPCRVIASNAAHTLFCGIAGRKRASRVASVLFSPEMFSGWGIRTLSSAERRYNPMSYHNGSVWPHDNALAACGLSHYGYRKKAVRILDGFFEASQWLDLNRLPELFCGFAKRKFEGPTQYPVACSPQAWSVASVFMLLQACLGIEINAVDKMLIIRKPVLPESVEYLNIQHLPLEKEKCCNVLVCKKDNKPFVMISDLPSGWRQEILLKNNNE